MKKRLKQADGRPVKEEHYAGALEKGSWPWGGAGRGAKGKRGTGGDCLESFLKVVEIRYGCKYFLNILKSQEGTKMEVISTLQTIREDQRSK